VKRRRAEERILKSLRRLSRRCEVEILSRTLEGRSRPIACAVLLAAVKGHVSSLSLYSSNVVSFCLFVCGCCCGVVILALNELPPSALMNILHIS